MLVSDFLANKRTFRSLASFKLISKEYLPFRSRTMRAMLVAKALGEELSPGGESTSGKAFAEPQKDAMPPVFLAISNKRSYSRASSLLVWVFAIFF